MDNENIPKSPAYELLAPRHGDEFVARFYNVTLGKVRQWRRSKTGPPYIKISAAQFRYRLIDLHLFAEQLRQPPLNSGPCIPDSNLRVQ